MIRVHPIPAAPEVLTGDDSLAAHERAQARKHWTEHGTMKGFTFRVYKDARVVKALEAVFHGKCAYCEFSYAGGAPCDVEHYRPKGGVDVAGKLTEPGYYWLAAEWTNLLPSCVDCNRARYQEFPDADPELSGKANKFPIADAATRATQPGGEAFEQRLLLHPYLDDPALHLRFAERGVVQAAVTNGAPSRMGEASIETYGLNRSRLVEARENHWVLVSGYVRRIKRTLAKLTVAPDDPDLKLDLSDDLSTLERALGTPQPFLGMVRQLVRELEVPLD